MTSYAINDSSFIGIQPGSQSTTSHANEAPVKHLNDKEVGGRLYFCAKLAQTILLRPITKTVTLGLRTVKLLTWDITKAALYKVSGYHTESADFLKNQYLKTVKAVRDILLIPSVANRARLDIFAPRTKTVDTREQNNTKSYINPKVQCTTSTEPFTSYLHGSAHFEVISPDKIIEFPATSDAVLQTIMASNLFKADVMAINFGSPNVATFVMEAKEDGSVDAVKVDAKSLKREEMTYHGTKGKIQSGVFLVPTNLPDEALKRFKDAATKLQGRKDITCVNTNCRVLEAAGFSIEGVAMDEIVFPNTMMEHFLFRNVFYTDSKGVKHKIYFDIVNTTTKKLDEYFEGVDTAVVGTRLRHAARHSDTEEKQKARGEAATVMIKEENDRLGGAELVAQIDDKYLGRRKFTISVPSFLGSAIARIWGRHTIYELDLSDKREKIAEAFQGLATNDTDKSLKLRPFPQKNPSKSTILKKHVLFSGPVIRFLRRHMMGQVDVIHAYTQDIFSRLKGTKGERLNYVLLDDKIVLARVHANGKSNEQHKKIADWALSKHALLSGRQDVYCSGEMWYDEATNQFMMNQDSGTYEPTFARVEVVARLANEIFDAKKFNHEFTAAPLPKEEAVA